MTLVRTTHESYTTQPEAVTFDPEKGEAYNVKMLGWESRNGQRYIPEKCSAPECVQCYEGVVCNVDHNSPGSNAPAYQPFASRFGWFSEPYARPDGIYAKTFSYNTAHPWAKTFEQWCARRPSAVGFSQVADCRLDPNARGERAFEAILKVFSVDLVANPATTKGIFESVDPSMPVPDASASGGYETDVGKLVASIVNDASLSNADKRKKVLIALKLIDEKDETESETPDTSKETESLREENKRLKVKLDAYQVAEAVTKRRAEVVKLCEATGLPKEYVTETFIQDLTERSDNKRVQESIEDRRALIRGDNKPTSAGQTAPGISLDEFLKELAK